ncbi:MAG: ATP-binding cassette domain-containing protein, partial [Fimbriimonadales bacterium]
MLASIRNATKIYGQHKALNNVTFDLAEGEVHCLVGENGAGKSTLTKILSGAIAPDSGTIVLDGTEHHSLTPRQAIELGVATVYQEPELIESLTVADNIYLGDERSAAFPLMVDTRTQNERARQLIGSLHFDLKEDALVKDLSSAQKQMLQIVKARYRDAKIIIMDEPTSSFGREETNSLMDLIRSLKAKGIGIIYISHFLEQVFEIGDRITILKDGESMGTFPRSAIGMDTVIRKMVGRDASLFYAKEEVTPGPVQLEIRHLGRRGVVEDVSFEVRSGEIFGLGGLVGSGRSELVNLIFGADRRD